MERPQRKPGDGRHATSHLFQKRAAYKSSMGLTAHTGHSLPADIAGALARGATIVTANQRAARQLRRAYTDEQQRAGETVWQPPVILSWQAWTASLWQQLLLEGVEERLLLSTFQEQAVWADVVTAKHHATLQHPHALAALAQRAWALLAEYRGLHRLRECNGSVDADAFFEWASEFASRCRREGWLPLAELEDALSSAIASGKTIQLPNELLLVGFDRMSPAQQHLCDVMRERDMLCSAWQPAAHMPARHIVAATDSSAELHACAQWVRAMLAEQPSARIAVILPQVSARRSEIERVFRSVLSPELLSITASSKPPFEFALGTALASTPMIAAALALLRWVMHPLPFEQASALLLSPFIGGVHDDWQQRARWDMHVLRRARIVQPEVTLEWAAAQLSSNPALHELGQHVNQLRRAAAELGLTREPGAVLSYTDSAEAFRTLLKAAGWPGSRPLDSTEYQLQQKWEELLDQLCTLDFTRLASAAPVRSDARKRGEHSVRVSYPVALEALERLAQQTLFAPESSDAPVQVMGVLEAAGSTFDAVWFADATSAAWPQQGRTHPLLPWPLQRSLAMPYSEPAAEYDYARTLTQRIAASAPRCVFSYATLHDGVAQRPSSLLREIEGVQPMDITTLSADSVATHAATNLLEEFDSEGTVPPLLHPAVKGGASVLQSQSQCPFRAFAERRLVSTEPASLEAGFTAMQRGSLVHSVLEQFWSRVATQQGASTQQVLATMSMHERNNTLSAAAEAAVRKHIRPTTEWEHAFCAVQQEWLVNLLGPWLEFELQRPPFAVVSTEEKKKVDIGPLELEVRIDRVDRVGEAEVVIDYKTGKSSRKDWEGGRPDQPQLPLYAATSDSPTLRAVAFAQVRVGDMCMTGVAAHAGLFAASPAKGEVIDFALEVSRWQTVLEKLAYNFRDSVALVDPKTYPKTCEYCVQRPLCRISELRATLDLIADEDELNDSETNGGTDD